MRKVLYIFGLLNDTDVEWIARTEIRRRVKDKDILIEERKPAELVIFILEGVFAITAEPVGEIARIGAGEIVGEMSFVDYALPSATVMAVGDGVALFLDKEMWLKARVGCGLWLPLLSRVCNFPAADRLRGTVQRLGYGDAQDLDPDMIAKDELGVGLLDALSMAGERFTGCSRR